MPDHENQKLRQFYNNFTTILRQFYSEDYYSVGSIPISTKIDTNEVWDGYCKIRAIFRQPTLGRAGTLSEQNCCKIVVNFAVTITFEKQKNENYDFAQHLF